MLGVPLEAGAEFATDQLERSPGRFRIHEIAERWAEVKLVAWCTADELVALRAAANAA